ncbi:MAG: hypothetical protein J4N32_00400 [Chloroflexi bacterium]|nr:hypothetical protein [Chloroflexota bacterium]
MAKVVLVEACSHSPFLFLQPEQWNEVRAARPPAPRNPEMSEEDNLLQHARCMAAFAELAKRLDEAKPDVLIVFGDDQSEQFDFNNFPPFAIFTGDEYEGYRTLARQGIVPGTSREWAPKTKESWVTVKGHPELAKELLLGLSRRDFDVSFMMDLPNKEHGMGHAFMRPLHYIRPAFDVPVVPVFVNCYYGPQPTAMRCYQFGRAIREVIEASPLDARVAVLGSGGLWHTPGMPDSWIDEAFDEATLAAVRSGDAKGMAERFDAAGAEPPPEYADAAKTRWIDGGTGMYAGIGGGTGETRNWIVAAAVADGRRGTVVDYVPVYASPCGMGFAYWDMS